MESFNRALKLATRRLLEVGLTGFVDGGGRHWKPDTYVAMTMRSTYHNVSRAAFWERNEEYANDLYLVTSFAQAFIVAAAPAPPNTGCLRSASQHPGARPLCYPWQCKVISRKDEARVELDGDNNPVHVYAQSETTYGEPAGLFGINCGHHPELFIPGATKVPALMQNEQENAETYALSQKQRKLERDFRKARLEYESAKGQGAEKTTIDAAREKLKRADERLDRFEKETGRRRRREREYGPVQAKGPTSSELTRKVEEAAKGGRHPESAQKAPESAQKPAESDRRPPESAQDIAETRKSVTEEQAPVEKPLTDEAKDDKIEAQGFNWNDASFYTETKFARHADRHMAEFGYLSREEYLDGARKLLSSDISEAVEGFTGKDGFVFRYDVESNALAIGHPGGSISTYFKPTEGREYWNDQIRKYKP